MICARLTGFCAVFMVALVSIVVPATSPVDAQSLSVQIDPAFHQVIAEPGQSLTINHEFTNLGDPNVYSFQVYRVTGHDRYGNVALALRADTPIRIELEQDGEPIRDAQLLTSSQRTTIQSRITIPAGIEPGEYAFALVGRREAQPSPEGAITTRLNGGVGALMLLTVSSTTEERPEAQISEFQIGSPFTVSLFGFDLQLYDINQPIPISLVIENTGSHHLIPRGSIDVIPTFGRADSHPITPGYILPEQEKLLATLFYDQEVCLSRYSRPFCEDVYTLVLPGSLIGVYEITASIQFDIDGPSSFARQFVIVLPYRVIGVMMIVIIGIALSLIPRWRRIFDEKKKDTKRSVGLTSQKKRSTEQED